MPFEEELGRVAVIGDDGSRLTAIEFRLVDITHTPRGERRAIGARNWRLGTGEPITLIDRGTFLVPSTGEWLVRDDT